MSYTPLFEKEYENGWEDFPSEDTLITAHALNMYDDTFEHIEEYLSEGGGGASALEDLDDVNITSPTDGQVLKYDATNDEWVNGTGGGGGTNAQWTQTQTNGTKIAEIEIDNVSQDVYDSTWSGTHAEYELVKNDLPDGTKIFFTDDSTIKTKTVTGTTSASGNLSLALDSREVVALSARTQNASSQDVLCVLWINGNTWYAKVLDQSMNIITSATATVTVYYMDL